MSYNQDDGSSPLTMNPAALAAHRTISGDLVGNKDLNVGDAVDVPGGMHGVVRFIGEVKGKKGIFAGVELNKEWAARGKNDGDVEGWVSADPVAERRSDKVFQCPLLHNICTRCRYISSFEQSLQASVTRGLIRFVPTYSDNPFINCFQPGRTSRQGWYNPRNFEAQPVCWSRQGS